MNTISAVLHRSEFASEPHLAIAIDGEPLDLLVSRIHPEDNLNGLVPTLLDWISDPQERQIIWERILPPAGVHTFAPVLMCPDDLDLWCTVIIVEVVTEPAVVRWSRIGLDATKPAQLPKEIGSSVAWLTNMGPYCFERTQYEYCLQQFRMSHSEEPTPVP